MDDLRRRSIETALADYRRTVLEQNLIALGILIEAAENEPGTDEDRLRLFHEWYRVGGGPGAADVASPREFLENDDVRNGEIVECSLDGVDHGVPDVSRHSPRQVWFDDLQRTITHLHVQNCPDSLPEDFLYLATLVEGICGPGLPYWREMQQFPLLGHRGTYDDNVVVPLRNPQTLTEGNALTHNWAEWQISVGIRTGDGPRGWSGCYLLYCARLDVGKEWGWRYGLQDETYESEVFDTLEQFLGWYARFNEQTEENIEPEFLDNEHVGWASS